MTSVRSAAVAGMFYPGNPRELSTMVESYLAEAETSAGQIPKAIIAPHAGYVYSGAVAATAYARVRPAGRTITRVVLLGPCHRVPVRGLAVSGADAFRTPLGDIPVDKEAVARILDLPQVQVFDATHVQEHSLEVHLPFLQEILDDFGLVPLVAGDASPEEVAQVMDVLWGGPETLIVVSSDLSHFLDYDTARKLDRATCQAIERMDPGRIGREMACGRIPVSGLLTTAKRKGMRVETVDLRNSGDTAGGKDRVVGYGSWLFFEGVAGSTNKADGRPASRPASREGRPRTVRARTASPARPIKLSLTPVADARPAPRAPTTQVGADTFAAATRTLLARHGETLLRLAASSIEHGLSSGKALPVRPADHAPELRSKGACFVTLKKGGRLRGCIGSPQAHRPLVIDTVENGYRAAFKDPRFPALAKDEVDALSLSISVLSAQSPIRFRDQADLLRQLRPGVDGLVIDDGERGALFLPSVWEQIRKRETFLSHLKVKAGLPADHWSDTFRAWRFVAEEIYAKDLDDPSSIWRTQRT